ncbi:brain and acute leukemia cytoplasmic protein isoform X1 [Cavia porcellus]|uniref:BAALC binder of MAP3K1 and KLF4 n=1 Tax=Cavia porcellus TaxID=10141 RepID=A0A286XGE6_CAVPO|nr:brain and acute leukemia cytoplasmic protein isoform X1 [Cavia porcellus]
MGCGGSRADALEPRYLESWTRDTESTWLTGSDTDAGPDGGLFEVRGDRASVRGAPEDGPSPSSAPRATVPGGVSNPEKKMNGGTQKQNGLWTTEAKRDTKRMSAKEVTIHVPAGLRQMDRSNRVTKNCVN